MKRSAYYREVFVRILLLFCGCVVSALIVEGVCRIFPLDWSEERARFYQYDSEMGWRGKPGASGTFRTSDFSTWVQQNSRGLRAPEIPYEGEASKRRFLVLGDSFVWGFGVNAEDRFTEVLQRELPNATVINAGCSGYGTDQELLFYLAEGRRYEADTVIVALHLRSDVKNNVSSREYGSYKPVVWSENGQVSFKNIPVSRDALGHRAMRLAQKYSAFAVWVFGRRLGERKVGVLFADGVNFLAGDAEPQEMISNLGPVEATCELASILTREIAANHARPVFIVIPDVRPDTRQIQEKAEFAGVRDCLKRLPATVIDLTGPLAAALKADETVPVVFEHDLHWTPAGHAVVGRAIAEGLKGQ